jgi:tRNA-Thr(GGU) m(6)t(6)A37 methyltransferase TsaA
MPELDDITLQPIGYVRNGIAATPRPEHDWSGTVSEILLRDGMSPALEGLARYSHVLVIYWADRAIDPAKMDLTVRHRGDPGHPMVGVFASRSCFRPNPLGLKLAHLLEVKGSTLRVEGLDALDGTPVLDVKPFIPGYDSAEGALSPDWE